MTFMLDTDTDTLVFSDGLRVKLKFLNVLLRSPKGTIVEFLGPSPTDPVILQVHPLGSTVVPPPKT